MTKRLDPEIKALRAIDRALTPLSGAQAQRSLEWTIANALGWAWLHLPQFPQKAASKPGEDSSPDGERGA